MFRKVAKAVPQFEKRMDSHTQIDISPLCRKHLMRIIDR